MDGLISVDIIYQIMRKLDSSDMLHFMSTCKKMNNIWKNNIISLLDSTWQFREIYKKIKHHKYLRTFECESLDRHMSFIISVYKGETIAVNQYLEGVKKDKICDIVPVNMFIDLSSDYIPLSAHVFYDSISNYILSVHGITCDIGGSISTIRLALHAASIGDNLGAFVRLLQILYPKVKTCEYDDNIIAGDYELWEHTFHY